MFLGKSENTNQKVGSDKVVLSEIISPYFPRINKMMVVWWGFERFIYAHPSEQVKPTWFILTLYNAYAYTERFTHAIHTRAHTHTI